MNITTKAKICAAISIVGTFSLVSLITWLTTSLFGYLAVLWFIYASLVIVFCGVCSSIIAWLLFTEICEWFEKYLRKKSGKSTIFD